MARKKTLRLKGIVEDLNVLEAFEKLQVNINLSSVDKKLQVIQVTSSLQDEGKTTVAVNLAYSYARKDKKVLVIDLDIRRPKVHRSFNQPNENGIVDYAAGKIGANQLIKKTNYNVDIILSGSKTPYPTKILESEKLAELINSLREKYDYIIVDTPPVSAVVDPLVVSSLCDGLLFVVEAERTKKSFVKESIKQLENINVNIIGLVLQSVRDKYSKYSYKYYYTDDQ